MKKTSISNRFRRFVLSRTPGQLVIQLTNKCNATCPQCGMRVSSAFKRETLDNSTVKRIIDAASKKKVKALSITGGELFLMIDDLCTLLTYAGQKNIPYLRTGTNGFFLRGSEKTNYKAKISAIADKLSETPVRNFWISVDSSLPEIHEEMRGFKGLIQGIRKSLPLFHSRGLYPSANLGINRNIGGASTRDLTPHDYLSKKSYEKAVYTAYRKAFTDFYEFVISLGFTIVNACYPMSIPPSDDSLEAVYAATTTDAIVSYTGDEKRVIFKALFDTIPEFRHKIRIFSPRVSLYNLSSDCQQGVQKTYPCQGGLNYHFIEAGSGDTFPCGYRGTESSGKFWNGGGKIRLDQQDCRLCDWECFRDPSEITGPIVELITNPFSLVCKMKKDPSWMKIWKEDMLYYRSCDFFDGRKEPDMDKLAKWKLN